MQGNVTPAAEFNVWADPESAAKVFSSGIPIRMVPLDVCHKTRFGREDLNKIGTNKHPFCQFVQEAVDPWLKINPNLAIIDQGLHLYDSLAMALCFKPELAEYKDAFVSVETKGEFTDGETVCEFNESIMGQIFKPKPNSDPHGGIEDFIEQEKQNNQCIPMPIAKNAVTKSPSFAFVSEETSLKFG